MWGWCRPTTSRRSCRSTDEAHAACTNGVCTDEDGLCKPPQLLAAVCDLDPRRRSTRSRTRQAEIRVVEIRGAPRLSCAMAAKIRVSFCMNAGPKRGVVAAAAVCDADARSLLTTAANKLKLRKAGALRRARDSSYGGAAPSCLPAGPATDVQNGDTIAVSLGEPYAGPAAAAASAPPLHHHHLCAGISYHHSSRWSRGRRRRR